MKALLINPYYPISETPSPPLGLAYLAGALEEAGIEAQILDFVVYPYTKGTLEAILGSFGPQMVGLTSVTMTFDHAIKVIKNVKAIDPGILTIMGGPHVTFRAIATMEEFPGLDMIVLGEGEKTIVAIAGQLLNKGRNWKKIPSIVYRDGSHIQIADKRWGLLDMKKLPRPSRHLLPLGRYKALGMPIT